MKRNSNPYQCEICGQPYLIPRKNGYFLKIRGAVFGNDLKNGCRIKCKNCKAEFTAPIYIRAN